MLDEMIKELAESYELKQVDNKDYEHFKVSGMNFEVKAYDAQFLGRVSTMEAKMPLGLMKMKTLIINPFELDAPLFSFDLIEVPGKINVILEQYDTLVASKRKEDAFLQIAKKYAGLQDRESKPNWYDDLRYASCIGKKVSKKEKDQTDALIREYFEAYLDVCRDAHVCERDEKKAKADVYRDGLLEHGGPATDAFLKSWGKEKCEQFFKEVLFG